MRYILDNDLIGNARNTGAYFQQSLRQLSDRHEIIGDVRGLGLLAGGPAPPTARPSVHSQSRFEFQSRLRSKRSGEDSSPIPCRAVPMASEAIICCMPHH